MSEVQHKQLNIDDKCYILLLAGGLGARIIQTSFIRSLIKKRKVEKTSYPIIVVDNSLIGFMVSEALKDQNVFGLQVPDGHGSWPQDPAWFPAKNGIQEHPMFDENWRMKFQNLGQQNGAHDLLHNNLSRSYSIEYGFMLTKLIHQHKLKDDPKSFIGYHYSKTMGLEYDGGVPMLKQTIQYKEIEDLIKSQNKPYVLMHLGEDRNPQEFMQGINYRTFKVWSNERWAEVVDKLKNKYNFIQIHANQHNPDIPGVQSIKIDNLNPILQLLNNQRCKFFMSVDNNIPHLAATTKKRGIVLWGSVSPYVWGWQHNINVWNKSSCLSDNIACWRPGMFDSNENGKIWVCPHYSCMTSITTDRVIKEVSKLEKILDKDKGSGKITL